MMEIKRYTHESLRDEKGMALVVSMLLIVALLLLGTTAVMTSTTDMKISANYKTGAQAFYAAEAGVEEMRARLKAALLPVTSIIKDPNIPDPKWSAYIITSITSDSWTKSASPDHQSYTAAGYKNYKPTSVSQNSASAVANTLQSIAPIIPYTVRVKHKTEYDAEQQGHTPGHPHYTDLDGNTTGGHTLASPGNIVYYGYRNSTATLLEYFTSASVPTGSRANPVEMIRSYGSAGNGGARVIEVEVRRPIGTSVPGAVYGNTIAGGGTVTVDGRDNPLCSTDQLPAVAYVTDQELCGSGGNITCYPTGQQTAQVAELPLVERVAALQKSATDIVTEDKNNFTIGSPTDYRVVYIDATVLSPDQQVDFHNLVGYGTLVVKGDVYFSGNLSWHGLIVATGQTDFYGGGADDKNVTGAVLSNTTATLQGKVSVKYDSCEINKANESMTPVTIVWSEKSGS